LDIIKLIIDPPIPACDPSDRKSLLLQAATQITLSIDYIWSFKNQVVHSVKQGNIVSLCKGLDIRIIEHLQAANQIASPEPCRDAVWTALAVNQIKLNVDAAWCSVKSSMAVVARDHKGIVLKAWSKMVVADEPLVAETHAIKWAIELASLEDYQNFMVESDAKVCIEAILGAPQNTSWKINTLCFDINCLAYNFSSCKFAWIMREANMVAHELAKIVPSPHLFICCLETLPPSVLDAWQRNVLGCSLI
jgi:hypothetical protein